MQLIPTLLAASLAAACGAAAAQAGSAPANHGTAGPQAPQARPAAQGGGKAGLADQKLADADRRFVENAAQSGLAEVQASRMAQQKATHPQVRQFADRMVKDHTEANRKLARLARAAGAEVPTGPSLLQKGKLELLEHTGKDDFDARYIDHLGVDAHKDAIELFERQMQQGQDSGLVQFARETLPKLQDHLRMAQDLQRSLQARSDQGAQPQASATGDKGSDTRQLGAGAPAVQNQSSRVSDTGAAPTAVDRRTPGTKPACARTIACRITSDETVRSG